FDLEGSYVLRLTGDDGELATSDDTTVTVQPPIDVATFYVTSSSGDTVSGISFKDEDILAYDVPTGGWSMHFDGSDVGLSGNVDDFHINADGTILLSMTSAVTIPITDAAGNAVPTLIDDFDIVRFVPTSLGENTAGTFEWYLDGSDVGLGGTSEDIDGIGFAPDGRLVVSTTGSFSVPDSTGLAPVSGKDEDLIVFNASSLGEATSGFWALYFDGSDVDLGSSGEDVNGTEIDDNGDIYLTTKGLFSVPGVSGDGNDIFVCGAPQTGDTTTCTYTPLWDGSASGLPVTHVVDGFDLAKMTGAP
ncbi:MAG: hypothetical protein L0Z68_03310, partial [Gammaproteobacteria bacterium]|nr:hypothetical protein [Gammaproteobacteria bacterium]